MQKIDDSLKVMDLNMKRRRKALLKKAEVETPQPGYYLDEMKRLNKLIMPDLTL